MSTPSKLTTVGLTMPAEFPVAPYEAIHAAVTQRSPLNEHYAGAWNAVAYRYLAMAEYGTAFGASIAQHGTAPPSGERYKQERDLFGFFANGLATLESAFYGTFAIGHYVDSLAFALDRPRNITPTWTRDTCRKTFPGDAILGALDSVLDSDAYKDLADIRNILAHRTAPGRQIFLQAGTVERQPRADEWNVHAKRILLEPAITTTRQADVARLLTTLLDGVRLFVARRL